MTAVEDLRAQYQASTTTSAWEDWLIEHGIAPRVLNDPTLVVILESWLAKGRPWRKFVIYLAKIGIAPALTDPAYNNRALARGRPTAPLLISSLLESEGEVAEGAERWENNRQEGRMTPIVPDDDLPKHRIVAKVPGAKRYTKTRRPYVLRTKRPDTAVSRPTSTGEEAA